MKYVKRIVVFASLAIIATAFVAIALPLAALQILGLRRAVPYALYSLARWWANRIIQMSGSKIHCAGTEHIPARGPVCFVSNHSGIFDIVLCLSTIGRPFGFIAKKELAFIPFLNLWILLLGGMFIERNNPRKALKTISDAAGRVKAGGAMIIFPEGTRSKGRGLLPFKSGAMKLAVESGAPIVPVAISGSYDVFERTGFIEKVNVSISFGQAFDQTTFPAEHKRQAIADATHQAIADMLSRHVSA